MKKFPNRWIFIPRKSLLRGYATYRCHCICCSEEWHDILKDTFKERVECPFCKQLTGTKDFEVTLDDKQPGLFT